ncbi:MAG: DUF1902 domain-containing protein [Nevskia sp.]|nr:DUF1902 domain-containing protein [Nevskia sp.]
MNEQPYTVECHWDAEAGVWYVAHTDIPGLATEAATLEELQNKLLRMIPELLELNGSVERGQQVPFKLIAHECAVA